LFYLLGLKKDKQSGQAMVEMVLVSLGFFMIVLSIIQFALIMNAKFLLNYASQAAARAGVISNINQNEMLAAASVILSVLPGSTAGQERLGESANFGNRIKNIQTRAADTLSQLSIDNLDDQADFLTVTLQYQYYLYIPFINRVLHTGYLIFGEGQSEATAEQITETIEEEDLTIPLLATYKIRKFPI
jgi:Flp pilus assembly protein TadG